MVAGCVIQFLCTIIKNLTHGDFLCTEVVIFYPVNFGVDKNKTTHQKQMLDLIEG